MVGGGAVKGGSLVRRERVLRWSRRVLMAGLAAVLVAGPIAGPGRVAEQLTAVAGEALEATGHEAIELEVTGREALLTGHGTEDEFATAGSAVARVEGIRRVDTDRTEPLPASLRLTRVGPGIQLAGTVVDADIADRLRAAVSAASGMHVIGSPDTDPRVERAGWLARTPTLAAAIPETPGLVVVLEGDRVMLSGKVGTSEELASVRAAAAEAFPDRPVEGDPLVTALTAEEAAEQLTGLAVVFPGESVDLPGGAASVLDEVATILRRAPDVAVEISAGGPDDDDEDLGQDRAEAVLEYLVDYGVDADRLTAAAHERGRRATFTVVVEEAD